MNKKKLTNYFFPPGIFFALVDGDIVIHSRGFFAYLLCFATQSRSSINNLRLRARSRSVCAASVPAFSLANCAAPSRRFANPLRWCQRRFHATSFFVHPFGWVCFISGCMRTSSFTASCSARCRVIFPITSPPSTILYCASFNPLLISLSSAIRRSPRPGSPISGRR